MHDLARAVPQHDVTSRGLSARRGIARFLRTLYRRAVLLHDVTSRLSAPRGIARFLKMIKRYIAK